MTSIAKAFVTAVIGTALGLWLTYAAVDRSFDVGAVQAGPWTLIPKAGSPDADPYARAKSARSGEIPLGIAEGLTFVARRNSRAAPLDPACEYTVSGNLPVARYWTLNLMSPDGQPLVGATRRSGFTSSEIVRAADGAFSIVLAPQARPGNWLMLDRAARFVLMLRVYDTAAGATISSIDPAAVPSVTRGRCA